MGGGVAEGFQEFGEAFFASGQRIFGGSIGTAIGVGEKDAVAKRMAAGERAAAGRRADGSAGIEAVEANGGFGHGVKIERGKDVMAVVGSVATTLIVGHGEDDIGGARERRRGV